MYRGPFGPPITPFVIRKGVFVACHDRFSIISPILIFAGIKNQSCQGAEMGKWIAVILFPVCISATAGGMKSNEFNDFVGQYQLANGRTLTMAFEGRRQVAEIDGIGRMEVVAVSDTTFVAKDGGLQLKFDRWKNGSVTGVVVEWPRDAQVGKYTEGMQYARNLVFREDK